MNRFLVLSLSALLLFFGCAGSKPKPVTNKDLPSGISTHQNMMINLLE